jgi:hypothetical protein
MIPSLELFPEKVKGPVVPIATFTNWGLPFVVTKTFVNLKDIVEHSLKLPLHL